MEIYKITNIITGKSYIGKTTIGYVKRFEQHVRNANKGINRRLYDSIRHHGVANFSIEVLYTAKTHAELAEKEISLILQHNTLIPTGYNMTVGGEGGNTLHKWTELQKQALYKQQGKSRTGKPRTLETKQKIAKAHKGLQHSEATKEKIRNIMLAYQAKFTKEERRAHTAHLRKYDGNKKGYKHSKAARAKISNARMGKTYEEIYSADYAREKRKQAQDMFILNNPNAYSLSEYQKTEIIKSINTDERAADIAARLHITLYKMRQVLKTAGINNLQKYRGNKLWKIKYENSSPLGVLKT